MRIHRVHVEDVVESPVIELAGSSVCFGVGTVFCLSNAMVINERMHGQHQEVIGRTLCMYLTLRRKNGSGSQLPNVM
jgi:hypothetical protein